LEQICAALSGGITLEKFEDFLAALERATRQSVDQAGLIQCLQNAGIVRITIQQQKTTLYFLL